MFKKILLVSFLVGICHSAYNQVLISLILGDNLNSGKVEFGLDGGLTLSDLNGVKQSDMLSSFNLGFYFDIRLKKEPWLFHTGVIVKSNTGASDLPVYSLGSPDLDNSFAGGSVDRKLNYFNVPFMIKYKIPRTHFYAETGPMFGLLYNAHDEFTNTVNGDELTYSRNTRDDYHPLDAGWMTGAGYRLMKGNGFNIGVRYYVGFVDISVDDTGNSVKNESFYFTVGIPIGVKKAKERQKAKEEKENK